MPSYVHKFTSPSYREETIVDHDEIVIGTIRLKPSSVLWKPKGARKYHRVSLEKFVAWITDPDTKASKTKS